MKTVMALMCVALWFAGRQGWAVLAGVAIVLLFVAQAVLWPYGFCWVCKGSGRWYRNKARKSFRDCWWCHGAGKRLRVVRRIYNRFHTVEKKAR